ncbi:hypothetical protein LA303_00930 [Candidatus Sulfidibacterium hydrothermale]|uniref:hypothetical protein n=1 Tax=Candidatus Sulfidibacterium hydrothermale TaxID=2875962 RepID=UPI001F0A61C3|nr:hypothetical protein [Candidatus Sulfidibacterium hydrothermale]UBM62559.1 hypothetical protein LA303_00930 [Candidatus Sulfidibacterium hydrothermale]
MITQKFNPETHFLEAVYSGEITLKEILEYNNQIRKNPKYPRKLKILTDATEAEFLLSKKDLKVISEKVKQMLNDYETVYDAMIISKPRETAYSILYKERAKIENYKFQYFSTKKAASKWLDAL